MEVRLQRDNVVDKLSLKNKSLKNYITMYGMYREPGSVLRFMYYHIGSSWQCSVVGTIIPHLTEEDREK